MLKIRRKKLQLRYIVLIILIVIILFLVIFSYTLKTDRKLNKAESLIKDVIVFTQKLVYYPLDFVASKVNEFSSLKDVKKENDILDTEVDRIEAIETENIELRRQIDELKEELNIDYVLTDYEYLNATVISRNVGYWYNTITINKGTYNGVTTDMVVINAKGLIGRVIKTTTFTSDVRLLTTSDTNNKISVMISDGNTHIYGLINKYDYNKKILEVEGVSNTLAVNVGDKVYTSGMGGVFPSGILIGTVTEITTDEYDLSKIINVEPSADFQDINFVSILKRKSDEE